uniref:hypothetical protein n=1 Tax=Bacteroides stercoris TaxID=46506 RepID=UPI004026FE58
MKRNSTMSLFAAMLLLTGSGCILMTGCQKDYDGQIEILRNQIENGDVNVNNLLEKVKLIEKQIETLQEAAKEHAEFKESISKLIKDLEATKNELEGKIAELQKAMEENDQNIKNMIEQAVQEFDKKLLELSKEIDAEISAKYNELDGRIRKLEEQYESLQEKQNATEKAISDLKEEIANLKESQLEEKQKLENALKQLEELNQKLTDNLERIDSKLEELDNAAKENAQNLEQLREDTKNDILNLKNEVDGKINEIDTQLEGISDAVSELQDTVQKLNTRYDELDKRINKLIDDYDAQIEKIWEAINNGGGTTDPELSKLVEQLQNDLKDLQAKVAELNAKYLSIESLYGKLDERMGNVEGIVKDHTARISALEKQLDALGVRVTDLEKQVKQMEQIYNDAIADIENRLNSLENGSVPPADLSQIKQMLNELQAYVNKNTNDILQLKDNQAQQAALLSELESKMNAGFLALNNNYNALSGRVDEIYKRLEDALAELTDLGQLKADVLKNQKDILDLQTKYDELNGKMDKFVTITEVENMLADYYNKEQIDNMFAAVYARLDNLPNKDEMDKLIEEATKEIKDQLALMQGEINELKNKCTELEAKVDRLFNRIQSMVIIPQYSSNEEVELRSRESNTYELNVNVKINPADVLNEVTALEGYFHIDSREAIPTRGAGDAGPAFTVEKVAVKDAAEGIFTVTATCELTTVNPMTLPFAVAVEFKNSNNNRSTDYKGVRYVPADSEDQTTYTFTSGTGETVHTKADLGLSNFTEADIYQHDVLEKTMNQGSTVTQITVDKPVFEKIVGSSEENPNYKNLPVSYSMGNIYDKDGTARPELINYIQVDAHNGTISMKASLTPGVTTDDLTGYRVVIGLQARENGINYGKPAYMCVELVQKTTGNNI